MIGQRCTPDSVRGWGDACQQLRRNRDLLTTAASQQLRQDSVSSGCLVVEGLPRFSLLNKGTRDSSQVGREPDSSFAWFEVTDAKPISLQSPQYIAERLRQQIVIETRFL
jgi:hypothetical protein